MSVEAFERFIAHYEGAEDARLSAATVEDIALLIALRDSRPEGSPERERLSFAGGCAKRWLDLTNSAAASPVEEVRLQPLLRRALDAAETGGVRNVSPDQALLLHSASELLARVKSLDRYKRLTALLRPHANVLRELILQPAMPGLPSLAVHVTLVDAASLRAAPRREVSSFAGLAMLSRGHVLDCRGDVKVLDGVPDDCTLVVAEGSCLINGHLLGHVAASQDIEVRGNQAGTAIVSSGSVFVGACLSHSTAVSKSGSIVARRCEDPKMVFAGSTLAILGDTRGGTYMAPVIEIDGVASGGRFRVSKLLRAAKFVPLGGRGPVIELQRRVACEQVGKLIDENASRLVSRLAGVRRGIRNTFSLIDVAKHECETYAGNALMYLLGGESSREKLEEINRAERRLGFLNRIIAGIEVLSDAAEDRMERGALAESRNEAWREVDNELSAHLQDDPDASSFAAEREELNSLARNLSAASTSRLSDLLSRLREKRLAWLFERKELQQSIKSIQEKLREPSADHESYDRILNEASRVEVLSRVLQKARSRSIEDRLYQRAQSPFVQLMLKAIDKRRKRVKHYLDFQSAYRKEYDELSEKLLSQHHLNPPALDAQEEDVVPEATGYFEEGVTLCTEAAFLDEPGDHGAAVLAPSGVPGNRTYRRENDRIVDASAG